MVDLPEVCVAASYYLKSNFPNKKISLLSDINIENTFLDKKIVDSDILIIQECESLKEDHFPEAKFFWTGKNESKGFKYIW